MWDKTGTLTQKQLAHNALDLDPLDAVAIRKITGASLHPIAQSLFAALPLAADETDYKIIYVRENTGNGLVAKGRDGVSWRIGNGQWLGQPPGPTYIEKNGEIIGAFTPEWTYRPLSRMFKSLKEMGISSVLISGDQPRVLPQGWLEYFGDQRHFSCTPQQKRELVERHQHTAYLGDGLNDVEAIDAATVGIAVVENVLGYFPRGKGIIFAESLPKLPAFLRYAKQMKRWTKAAYVLSLLYNIAGITFSLSGFLSPVIAAILMPLSSITVVLFSTAGAYLFAPKG